VKEISDKNKSQGGVISTILMVGGFSDCPLLHERVTSEFPKLNVICPSDAVATVLKGAVMYGHNPELISERICPRTYGITAVSGIGTVSIPRNLTSLSFVYIGFLL
jgi:molecular chaperone DnaK (HSP70)